MHSGDGCEKDTTDDSDFCLGNLIEIVMEREGILNTTGLNCWTQLKIPHTHTKIRGNVSKNLETDRKTHLDF